MSLVLQDGILAEIVFNANLPWTPRLVISGLSLMLGPYSTKEGHERHFLETWGSGNWYKSEYDELRFNRDNGQLESLWFHIPEKGVQCAQVVSQWMKLSPIIGSLRLTSGANFALNPAGERWYDKSAKSLVCLQSTLRTPVETLRLKIAPSIDLFFADGQLFGWLLANPENFLVGSWQYPQVDQDDEELATFLDDYFDIVVEPHVEQMQDQDTAVLGRLKRLSQRISVDRGAIGQRLALRGRIDELIDFFYG